MCEACDVLFAFFSTSCHKNCDKCQRSARQIHSGDPADDFNCFLFDSAAMTSMEAARRGALVCEIKSVFRHANLTVWRTEKNKLSTSLRSFSPAPLIIYAAFCHSIQADEISHRRSHLLCLQLICLLGGSHQSLQRQGDSVGAGPGLSSEVSLAQ